MSAVETLATTEALANIRAQVLHLDPDELRLLQRILRQAQRLDAALADLHLLLPTIEICFYGVRTGANSQQRLSAQRLRKLVKRWGAKMRTNLPEKISRSERPPQTHLEH